MKLQPLPRKSIMSAAFSGRLLAATLTSAIYITLQGQVMAEPAGNEDPRAISDFAEKMKGWQNDMSRKFSDTFKELKNDIKNLDTTVAMVSVDLREKNDSYVLRLNLPDRNLQKVDVRLEGNNVSIMAPAEGTASRYEQTVVLNSVPSDAKPVIERKQDENLILVTIPKAGAKDKVDETVQQKPDPSLEPRDLNVLNRMDEVRREMDRIAKEAFSSLRAIPEHRNLFDESRFGSSTVLQDEGANYVVRAYLPGRDLKDLNVTVENQTLKIIAKAEATDEKKAKGEISAYKAQFAQYLSLPGPVLSDQMKVERKDDMVVVTLPKASPAG